MPAKKEDYILWFDEINQNDLAQVGSKGAHLGEMTDIGLPVPPGFVVNTTAYRYFLAENNLQEKITEILTTAQSQRPESYQTASQKIKTLINKAPVPQDLAMQIMKTYQALVPGLADPLVAVRSSVAIKNQPQASFAGQQATYLNVKGEGNVVEKVKSCWASLFDTRGIFYREEHNISHNQVTLAVPVQKMVQAETSGVLFTADPTGQRKNIIIIEAIWGLGEYLVQGKVIPDQYVIDFKSGKILEKTAGSQKIQLIRKNGKSQKHPVPEDKINKAKLSDKQIRHLSQIAKKIHRHYFFPQNIEWAREKGELAIIETAPITTIPQNEPKKPPPPAKESALEPILSGIPAAPGIGTGRVKKISRPGQIDGIEQGDVLVAGMTSPDLVPAMKLVSAIITDQGGQTSHAAIVSRELNIPCVVGTKEATKKLEENQIVTVDGSQGLVFSGKEGLKKRKKKEQKKKTKLKKAATNVKTATKLYVNLAEPSLAKEISQRQVEGVGLVRAEFMMAQIGTHPRHLIKTGQQEKFVDQLAQGLKSFCRPFTPRPVIYRTNDFKTNEYRHLKGGEEYENEEGNPLIGFRGVARYLADNDVFALELEAIKRVRNKAGLKNLWVMLPFVRTPEELREVKKTMAAHGLMRGPNFKLWLMVEVPSNVILLEKFIEMGIDGVSIGTNDLTMLLLGVDRDNSKLAHLYDEQNPAVLWALEKVIKLCQTTNVSCSICGQAPSSKPEIINNLVKWGINSISVNPDAINKARLLIAEAEKEVVVDGKN